jgi:hypothetical protein
MSSHTVVRIVPQMKTASGLSVDSIREFWRRTKPEEAPDSATVNLLDLCDEVDRLRMQVSTLKALCQAIVLAPNDKKLQDQILEATK